MLDEIDKMSTDFRGDPSAALLEVLDPEQNFMFMDHYLDVEYDLEPGLLHRHRQRAAHHSAGVAGSHGSDPAFGLHRARKDGDRQALPGPQADEGDRPCRASSIEFTDDGVNGLIQYYTREAGVRNLEREIGNVCRKIARQVVNAQSGKEKKEPPKAVINGPKLTELLGPRKFRDLIADKKNEVGATVGLAWTEVGGPILTTECTLMEGKGKLTITGKAGRRDAGIGAGGDELHPLARASRSVCRATSTAISIFTCTFRKAPFPRTALRRASPWPPPSAAR